MKERFINYPQTYIDTIIGIVGAIVSLLLGKSARLQITLSSEKIEIILEKEERIGSITAIALHLYRLKDKNDRVRLEAVIALGKLKNEAAVPALCKLLETDPNPEVRRRAAEALGEIGYTDKTGNSDRSSETRRLAAEALGIGSEEEIGIEHRR